MIIPTEEQSNRHDKKGLSEVSWKPKGDAFQIIPTPKSPCMGESSVLVIIELLRIEMSSWWSILEKLNPGETINSEVQVESIPYSVKVDIIWWIF